MNFSEKIINRKNNPKFLKKIELQNSLEIELTHNNGKLFFYYDTIDINDEVCFKLIYYDTNLKTEYLGILDSFVELMHNRPIEAIDRFPVKELDFYLRDSNSVPCVSGFNEKFYEILGLGEELKKSHFKISKDHAPKINYDFFKLSVSEQLDFIEEVFSFYIYSGLVKLDMFEIEDIEDDKLVFYANKVFSSKDLDLLENFLKEKIDLRVKVKILD